MAFVRRFWYSRSSMIRTTSPRVMRETFILLVYLGVPLGRLEGILKQKNDRNVLQIEGEKEKANENGIELFNFSVV